MECGVRKATYFIGSGVAYVMDGIMVLLLEEINLEREDGEKFIDIATDVLDAVLLPRPDLRRNVVKNPRNMTISELFTFRFSFPMYLAIFRLKPG